MITPAVLISACGTLILSTSNRLIGVVNQVRDLSDRFESQAHNQASLADNGLSQEKYVMLFNQLGKMTNRAILLQRGLAIFYLAMSIFVATSAAIGVVAVFGTHLTWIPLVFAFVGTGLLFYGCVLLILESRLALFTTYHEMDFLWRMGKQYAPTELLQHKQQVERLRRQ